MTEQAETFAEEPSPPSGSVVDDLAKLWLALTSMAGDLSTTLNSVAPPCNGLASCPLCRISGLLSQCSPEVTEHLSAATRSVLLAASAALKPDKPAKQGFEHITLLDDGDAPEQSE